MRRPTLAPRTGLARRRPPRPYRRLLVGVSVLAALVGFLLHAYEADDVPPSVVFPVHVTPDCDGGITDWVLCLPECGKGLWQAVFARIMSATPPDIRFHVFHEKARSRAALEKSLAQGPSRDGGRVQWHETGQVVWPWTRDLFLAATAADGRPLTLLHRPEHYSTWPVPGLRERVHEFARALDAGQAVATPARIDGGAVVVDAERVFASDEFLERAQRFGDGMPRADLLRRLQRLWGRPIEVLSLADVHESRHCDLVMMPAGRRRMVLGSPKLGAQLLAAVAVGERRRFLSALHAAASRAVPNLDLAQLREVDFLGALQARAADPRMQAGYERLKRRIEALGYACAEVPSLGFTPQDAPFRLTCSYTNVILDERGGRRTAYMPTYGLPTLDDCASAVWRSLGVQVVRIDCLGPALNGGGIHCMSHVFRSPAANDPRH